jgi:hypothetical protein
MNIKLLAEIAEREIGQREVTRNASPRIVEYQQSTILAPGSWSWCAAFVSWCLQQWLADEKNFAAVARNDKETRGSWRCKSARAFAWETWAQNNTSCLLLPPDSPAKRGDIVTFTFSHIGIVSADSDRKTVATVEGNTGADGGRDGDGVYAKHRDRTLFRKIIRIVGSQK